MGKVLLGKYELLERVGVGGMAEVYRARLLSAHGLSKIVAVKRILPYHCEDRNFVQMFLDEAKIALALNHACVGQIYELNEEDGVYFLAMEYIDGPNLSVVIKRLRKAGLRIPVDMVLYVLTQVCSAMYAAHTQHDEEGHHMHIIHRDVSPHNVMVGRSGSVKLIDFGIAKAKNRLVQTQAGTVRGKLLYMSPEQAASRPLDHRTDLFSAGMLLLTLVNGQHMWRGLDEVEVLLSIRNWAVPKISELRPDLDAETAADIQRVLELSMAFDQEDRYPDAEAFRADLVKVVARINPVLCGIEVGEFVGRVMDGHLDNRAMDTVSLRTHRVAANLTGTDIGSRSLPSAPAAIPPESDQHRSGHIDATADVSIADADTSLVQTDDPAAETPVPDHRMTPAPVRMVERRQVQVAATRPPEPMSMTATAARADVDQDPTIDQSLVLADLNLDVVETRTNTPGLGVAPETGRRWVSVPLVVIGIGVMILTVVAVSAIVVRMIALPSTPAVETAATGTLLIDSNPQGLPIFLDGAPLDRTTPARIEGVGVGEHELTLTQDEAVVHRQPFSMRAEEQLSFHAVIEVAAASPGTPAADAGANTPGAPVADDTPDAADSVESPDLLVYANEPKSKVFIDGEAITGAHAGPKEPFQITLEMGREYEIRVEKAGFESDTQTVVADSKSVVVKANLKRKAVAYLTVNAVPFAHVYVSGRKIGTTPLKKHRMRPGRYVVRLKSQAGQTHRRPVNLRAGQSFTIVHTFR
jgi:serine/threonine protein kinase